MLSPPIPPQLRYQGSGIVEIRAVRERQARITTASGSASRNRQGRKRQGAWIEARRKLC